MPRTRWNAHFTQIVIASFNFVNEYWLSNSLRDHRPPQDSRLPRLLADMGKLLLSLDDVKFRTAARAEVLYKGVEDYCRAVNQRDLSLDHSFVVCFHDHPDVWRLRDLITAY